MYSAGNFGGGVVNGKVGRYFGIPRHRVPASGRTGYAVAPTGEYIALFGHCGDGGTAGTGFQKLPDLSFNASVGGSRIVNVELARLTVGVNRRRVIILAVFQVGSGGNLVGSVENALGRCGGLDDDHFNTVGGVGRRTEAAVNSIPLQEITTQLPLLFWGDSNREG